MGPPIFFGNAGARALGVIAFWLVLYGWVFSEIWLAWKRRPPATIPAQDRGSRWVLITSVWLSVALAIGLASAAHSFAFSAGRPLFVAAGIVVMIAGIGLRWYAIQVLGRSFTVDVATRPGQRVVERGPYRLVRHPSYSGSLLTILGVLLACANPLAFLALIPALLAYAYRIHVEEEVLQHDLGQPYRDYMRRTQRLIPFVI